nr:sericin 1-like [Lytechinus pictus]
MSSRKKTKSWTFVPERSRPPPNKRATRRQTTLRAFTFVQDWDPKISPIPPPINNASQKKQSHKKDRNQPTLSQSSSGSIRESPIAQLVRSSPGPIIVSRRIPAPGRSPFNRSRALSPSPSIASQGSTSSKSVTGSSQTLSEKTGASPSFSVPKSRRQRSESKKRPPVSTDDEAIAISPATSESGKENVDTNIASSSSVGRAAGTSRLHESDMDSGGVSDSVPSRSSTAKKHKGHVESLSETRSLGKTSKSTGSGRSRRRRGPSLTFRKKSSKGRKSLSFQGRNKSTSELDSIDATVPLDNDRTEQSHVSSASDYESQVTFSRKSPGSKMTDKKGSTTKKAQGTPHGQVSDSSDVPVESNLPTPGSVQASRSFSSSDRSRTTSSRKRRGPRLTFPRRSRTKPKNMPRDEEVSTEINFTSSLSKTSSRKRIISESSESDRNIPETVPKSPRRKSPSLTGQTSRASSSRTAKGKQSSTSMESHRRGPGTDLRTDSISPEVSRSGGKKARTPKGKQSSRSIGTDSSGSGTDSRSDSVSRKGPRSGGKKARTPKRSSWSIGSNSSGSGTDSRADIISRKGPRSGGSKARTPDGYPLSKKKSKSAVIPKAVGKTPDRSMSFITATPRSGHVVRHQPRTQQGERSGPVKAKGQAGPKKRAAGTESSEQGEPEEKRAKVRLYTTGARPRLVGDTTDLDILFNCLEDTAMEFRETLDAPRHRKAVTKFMEHAKNELTDMISMQHDYKLQSLSLSRTNTSIRKYRHEVLDLQRENTRLDVKIAELKKTRNMSGDTKAKTLEEIKFFISDLKNLHDNYNSKFAKDVKSVVPVAQENVKGFSSELQPALELQSTISLDNKLREWLGS